VDSSPGQELLGAFTSHGPSRGLYLPIRASPMHWRTEGAGAPPANPAMPAQRMPAKVSPAAGAATLLRTGVPEGGAEVVALEGAAAIPGDRSGQRKTQRAKSALPRARPKPETSQAGRAARRGGEGNHPRFFSTTFATAPAATRASPDSVVLPPSGSVRAHAGAPWSGSGSVSGAGAKPCSNGGTGEPLGGQR